MYVIISHGSKKMDDIIDALSKLKGQVGKVKYNWNHAVMSVETARGMGISKEVIEANLVQDEDGHVFVEFIKEQDIE